jgi:hypothetical protein
VLLWGNKFSVELFDHTTCVASTHACCCNFLGVLSVCLDYMAVCTDWSFIEGLIAVVYTSKDHVFSCCIQSCNTIQLNVVPYVYQRWTDVFTEGLN